MSLAASQIVVTGVTHLSGCGEWRDVPEEDDAVFTGAHENGVVGVDRHIRNFPAVTSDGLSIPQGCGEGIQKAARGQIPHFDDVVVRACECELLRRVDRQTVDRAIGMTGQREERLRITSGKDAYAISRYEEVRGGQGGTRWKTIL